MVRELPLVLILVLFLPLRHYAQEVTFSQHIAPIIYHHCTPCHQKGEIAPLPLTNYDEVSAYGAMIGYVTSIGYMPPWKAENGPHRIEGQRGLTDREIALIQQWLEGGMPEGNPTRSAELSTGQIRAQMTNPDASFAMSEAFEQYGVYYDQYRVFVLDTHLEEDQIIEAIEFVPGNRDIVRSCMISVDLTDKVKKEDDWDPGYGYFSFGELGFVPTESRWYCWHPGKTMTVFPSGEGLYLPKKAKLLLHMHYGPTGNPQKDSSYIKVRFASHKNTELIRTAPLIHPYNMSNDSFYIEAEKSTRYHAQFTLPTDIELKGVFPQTHLLGRQWEIFAVHPEDKSAEHILKIKDWDFNWKQMYTFEQPILLKRGTTIHAIAAYDNTANNLSNPSEPSRSMSWGKRMYEELFLVFFQFKLTKNINDDIQLLPGLVNSCEESLSINFAVNKTQALTLSVHDFKNREVSEVFFQKRWEKGEHKIELSMADWPKGNYLLRLTGEKGAMAERIIVYLEPNIFD